MTCNVCDERGGTCKDRGSAEEEVGGVILVLRCSMREQQIINKVKVAGYSLGIVVFLAVAAWRMLVR
jgi:hypothetical protein